MFAGKRFSGIIFGRGWLTPSSPTTMAGPQAPHQLNPALGHVPQILPTQNFGVAFPYIYGKTS